MPQKAARRPGEVHTIPETAEILRCSEMHVYRLIAAGDLDATDIAVTGSGHVTKMRVSARSIEEFLERRSRGRAAGQAS